MRERGLLRTDIDMISIDEQISKILESGITQSASMYEFETKYIVPFLSILADSLPTLEPRLMREEIRSGILRFYNSWGMSAIVIFDKDGKLKLTKKIKDISKSPYLSKLLSWLCEHKADFENAYTNHEFSEKEVLEISQKTDEIIDFNDEFLRRDLIRAAIKKCFGFDVRDAIFLFDNRASIKNFDYDFVRLNNEIRELLRMPNIDPIADSQLPSLMHALEGVNIDALLSQITTEVLHFNTPLSTTSNIDFARLFPFYIRQKLRLNLEQFWDKNLSRHLKNLFCEHLFRTSLDTIYSQVVLELLSKCIAKEKEARKFIDFFNGKLTFLPDHKRIKRPAIRDIEGKIYNSESIYQLVQNRQYITNEIEDLQMRILDLENSKEELKEREERLNNELVKHQEEHDYIERELERITLEIKRLKAKGKGYNSALKELANSENIWLTKNHSATLAINELSEAIESLHHEKRKLPDSIYLLERKISQKLEASRALFAEYERMKSALLGVLISFQIVG